MKAYKIGDEFESSHGAFCARIVGTNGRNYVMVRWNPNSAHSRRMSFELPMSLLDGGMSGWRKLKAAT